MIAETSKVTLNLTVNLDAANAHIVSGLPQRKGINPNTCQMYTEIKYVKDMCRSLVFCKSCSQCPTCCYRSAARGQIKSVLGEMGSLGFKSKSSQHIEGGYTLPFRFRPHLARSPTVISNYHNSAKQSFLVEALYQLINKNAVEPVENQNSLGFYNRLFLVPKPNNRWRPVLDLSTLNTFLNTGSLKMETPETIRTSLQAGEWVTSIDFKDAYFHIPIHSQSRKYMRFHLQGRSYQFKALPFCLSTAPMEFTVVAKEVKLMALQKGIRIHQYLDDWLVRASTQHTCLQHTQTLVTLCQELGWLVNKEKSELVPKQVFNFVGYQFDLKEGRVRPKEYRWQTLADKIRSIMSDPVCPVRQFVPYRSTHSSRKTSPLRATSHETHTVALEEQLEGPRVTGKGDTGPQVPPPTLEVVAGGKQCASRSTITPSKTCSANLYRRIKRGWGAHLDEHTARGTWSFPESKLHINHLELKAVFLALKEFRTLVCNKTVLIATHPRPAERDSRQAIQAGPDHSNGVVASSRCVQNYMQPVAPASSGPVCHQIQQQTTTVCLTGPRSPGLGSGCTQPVLGGSGPIRLPTGGHLGQSGGKASGLPLQQNNSDCTRVAQHALVLGPGSNVKPDSTVSAQHSQPSVSTIQPSPSQEPGESESACLAPRASAIKEQGFTEAVAAQIEAPQRRSTRSVYEGKWTIFTKWCLSNQVDFRAPPLKAIADFLLHLF